MSQKIKFIIDGEPCAKGRPRFTKDGHAFTPKKTVSYESRVAYEYRQQTDWVKFDRDIPLAVLIKANFTIPKSVSKKKLVAMLTDEIKPTKRPDADNIGKIIKDALNGVAWHDDAQVTNLHVIKRYREWPCVEVEIWEDK